MREKYLTDIGEIVVVGDKFIYGSRLGNTEDLKRIDRENLTKDSIEKISRPIGNKA